MHIQFTDAAVTEMNKKIPQKKDRLKLVYETEGCGCAVNGVPQLWVVDHAEPHDTEISGNPFPVLVDQRHAVFFEEQLVIDFNEAFRTYVLKSDQQIYNTRMPLLRKTAKLHN